jgi:hypothetical protein
MVAGKSSWKWHRDKSNYHIEYENGSKIFFYGENINRDPDLNSMLGLECNGVGMEQVEELSIKTFEMAQTRIGSWYIDPMPKPLILMTLNPTQRWAKNTFYEPYRKDELKEPLHFIEALPTDNPYVTVDQWKAWDNMNERYKEQYIKGNWADLANKDDLWAYAFDRKKHIATDLDNEVWKGDINNYLYLSFDFNRNPITCAVIQHINGVVYFIKQYKLANSDIYKLCDRIKVDYNGFTLIVTGDATGQSGTAMVKDNLNYYKIIQKQLRLNSTQFKVPSVNPRLEENQVLFNSLLEKYRVQIHPTQSEALIYDCENVRMNADGTILKTDRTDPTQQADSIDCARYYFNQFHKAFIKMPI